MEKKEERMEGRKEERKIGREGGREEKNIYTTLLKKLQIEVSTLKHFAFV